MPPIYIGETPVTVYKGENQLSTLAIGETIINVYTPT
jgi:hypothetical protein